MLMEPGEGGDPRREQPQTSTEPGGDNGGELMPAEAARLLAARLRYHAQTMPSADGLDCNRLAFVLYLRAHGKFTEGTEE